MKELPEDYQDEAAWEESVLTKALGDAIDAEGNIDFDKLRARGNPVSLEELIPMINSKVNRHDTNTRAGDDFV